MRTDHLRDLIIKVYIYPHALFSAKDIVSGSLEEPFGVLQERRSVCRAMGVGCTSELLCVVTHTYAHTQPWKHFFPPKQQMVDSQRLYFLVLNNLLLGLQSPFSDT